MSRLLAGMLVLACYLLSGCATTPVGVRSLPPDVAYRQSYQNPLSSSALSDETKSVLNRYNLNETFKDAPAEVIVALIQKAQKDDRRDILLALSETAYVYGDDLVGSFSDEKKRQGGDYFLLAAASAYQFLLRERGEPPPGSYDPRLRMACDLYNFSLWRAFATGPDGSLEFVAGKRRLPVGDVAITIDTSAFPWKLDEFERFEPADKFAVRGVSVRSRTPGMGVPLVAVRKATAETPLGKGEAIPVTVFLRLTFDMQQASGSGATGTLEFFSTYDDSSVTVNGRQIPLESDITTPLTYRLENSRLWDFGLGAFVGKDFDAIPDGIYQLQPYRPGRIPVVFVHGTASSPVWWAEMFNTLRADPVLRKNFQFWFFIYKSNKLVALSAGELRDDLQEKVKRLDPDSKDRALQQMVVVGHSQGGLLTKFTAVETGDKLVRAGFGKGFDEIDTSEENKQKLRHYLDLKPLPFVKQVVFIATPHRGSFLSTHFVRSLISSLVKLPATIFDSTLELRNLFSDDVRKQLKGRMPTSVDSMSPDNPVLQAMAEMPLGPGIHGHSIIAIKDDSQPPAGDDGVVQYTSAHLEGMDSEFIVRSEHSCQMHPFTIEEVRRILLEHLANQGKQ